MVLNNLDSFTCIFSEVPTMGRSMWKDIGILVILCSLFRSNIPSSFFHLPPYPCKKRIFTSGYYHPTVLLESLIDWYFLLRISLQICIKNVLFCGSVGTIVWKKSGGQTFINRFHKFSPFSAWSPHLLKRKENQLRHI